MKQTRHSNVFLKDMSLQFGLMALTELLNTNRKQAKSCADVHSYEHRVQAYCLHDLRLKLTEDLQ